MSERGEREPRGASEGAGAVRPGDESPREALVVAVATRNEGKLRELVPMLTAAGFAVAALASLGIEESSAEDDLECHETFEGNALAKARHFAALLPGHAIVADDSGLVVDALGGAPGVRSKRFSGRSDLRGRELDTANNARLMQEMKGGPRRAARFVCAAAWVGPTTAGASREEFVALGVVEGRILEEPRGGDGFGYDPYFWSEELGRTFGESTKEEKQRVSHRARAVRALLERVLGRAGRG